MGRYLLGRLGQGLIVVFGVTVVVFVATRMIGDPVNFILPLSASHEQRERLRADLGFDEPIFRQFVTYLNDLLHLDFGTSTKFTNEETMDVVLRFLPKTLQLVAAGMAFAFVVSLVLGMIAATRPGKLTDKALVTLSLAGLSAPQFFLAQLLIVLFSVELGWVDIGPGPWTHLILPAVALALPPIGRLSMVVRSAMIDELNSQYVKAAKAKGVARHRIVAVHALRNAAIPFVTLGGWELIRALAGFTVVVEGVFGVNGLGNLAILAIRERDFFLIQTIVLVVAVMVVAINIAIDVIYKLVDPRVKLS
ncbi:MAG TPA: ABC transporter permease [Acidimicrobiales bacterium]